MPHPTADRTWFRLVVGGKHSKVLEVFRDVELRIIGREADAVRESARARGQIRRTGQQMLGIDTSLPLEPWYAHQSEEDSRAAVEQCRTILSNRGPTAWSEIWPILLEEHHLSKSAVAKLLRAAVGAGELVAHGAGKNGALNESTLLQLR